MLCYQILGQSNHAVAILLDLLKQIHEDRITVDIVGNIPPEENDSLVYGYDTGDVETQEIRHEDWQRDPEARLLIGSIGRSRERIFRFFQRRFAIEAESYTHALHPRAFLPLEVTLGHGVHVGPGATIAPHAVLGDFVVVNRNASVGHHTVLGDFVTLNPGVQVAGTCRLEHGVSVGIGAAITHGIMIGRKSVIGAGSVVTRDIPRDVVAYGVPARVVRERWSRVDVAVGPRILEFAPIGDASTGFLSVVALEKDIPFEVARVFWTYGTPPHVIRGDHAHYRTETVLVAVHGRIVVSTELVAGSIEEFILDTPSRGLYLPPLCWRTMKYSASAVQLAFESNDFSTEDYIRSLDDFRAIQHRSD